MSDQPNPTDQMPKVYDPQQLEAQAYQLWKQADDFAARTAGTPQPGQKSYTIVIPPPNVTAPLHLGHALNNTLQDILIRFHRMRQFNTLWMPGTDHAGIATQTVVEKRILTEEGKRRTDFPREEFVARVQAWKDEYEARIIQQLQLMGCSCDWNRTRFTMDDVCAQAVRAAFFKLFQDGLIYRGKRLVNWDPATQTVLADDEVEHETVQGHFWYLQYPLENPVTIAGSKIDHVTVATTRPETMLGDTAVAINPNDPRWPYLKDHKVLLPIVGRRIPIIADDHVVLPDPESEDEKARFSTGFLKVTPAHDPNDWEIGLRHDLPVINIMAPDGAISDKHGWTDWNDIKNLDVENLIGMDRFEARQAIVEWFRQENLLEDVRPYAHEVGHSYRSHVPIEPYLSDQWYIAVKKPIPGGLGVPPKISSTELEVRQGAFLPHWTKSGSTYAVVFRLFDSLPSHVVEELRLKQKDLVEKSKKRELTEFEQKEYDRLFSQDIERYLDAGMGSCFLKQPEMAKLIKEALQHFAGERYELYAWSVMPNHVHVVLKPNEGVELSDILHSWKSFTAHKANKLLNRTGEFWQQEYYDYLVRDEAEFSHHVNYAYNNPEKAGLKNWPWKYKYEELGRDAQATSNHNLGRDAQATLIPGTDVPVNSLAGLALKPLLAGRLRFIPERYARTYQSWLENLRDWPISRQLWWGHQIPVWSCGVLASTPEESLDQLHNVEIPKWVKAGLIAQQGRSSEEQDPGLGQGDEWSEEQWHFICVRDPDTPEGKKIVKRLEDVGYTHDPDVLDTWFSSALWPFSTLGWPEESEDLKTFYPGNVLCTAREIITLWVSRMVMMGQYCLGDIPFQDVFIHAMIQDGEGRKMSKSLGNGIDPLVAIDSHGADAMRFTLASMTTETQDVRMPVEPLTLPDGRTVNTSPKFDIGRNFCNKLWNASRFALTNLQDVTADAFDPSLLTLEDRWILSRLHRTIETTTAQIEQYKFSEPINALYRFFWNELCDWYLELIKPRMRDDTRRPIAQRVLAYVLDATLRLLHPFLPFITEGIYQQLNGLCPRRDLGQFAPLPPADHLIKAPWPQMAPSLIDESAEQQMLLLQDIIRQVREVRTRYQIAPRVKLPISIKAPAGTAGLILDQRQLLCDLASLSSLAAAPDCPKPPDAAVALSQDLEIYVHGVIDPQAEQKRLLEQKQQTLANIDSTAKKLANENFVARAKPEVVQRERDRLAQLKEQLASVEKNLDHLAR